MKDMKRMKEKALSDLSNKAIVDESKVHEIFGSEL